jgi:hypothetical protein
MRLAALATALNGMVAFAFALDPSFLTGMGLLATTVGVVVAILKYIDMRIEGKLASFQEIMLLRHEALLVELTHLREIVVAGRRADDKESA